MENETQKTGSHPDYKGDGVAVWVNKTKNGAPYLSIQVLGRNGIKLAAFKHVPTHNVTEETVI